MKIYEIIIYTDGGPNDRGYLQGFILAKSEKDAKISSGIKHNFCSFNEISIESYEYLKEVARLEYEKFDIITERKH